jgi:hypothetical protein
VLAEMNVGTATTDSLAATWLAVWVGVAPKRGIAALAERLRSIANPTDQVQLAMVFLANLLGGRGSDRTGVRQHYATPQHLKTLFLLMQTYVKEDDDIDRANGGVYSPELRDHAQDARNALYGRLRDIPGKEAFVALSEIARMHPNAGSRPWLADHALKKAEQDADLTAWSPANVREFNATLDRTPSTPRELADLAIMRLLDMKDDLEHGDESLANILQRVTEETEMRNFLGHELRAKAQNRFTVTQEEQLADDRRPDLRFHGMGFDAPVPAELKLAERWTGPQIFERFENQLGGDYLRDNRSGRGIFVLVNRKVGRWTLPNGKRVGFDELLEALRVHWSVLSPSYPQIDDMTVVGIDLSNRFKSPTKTAINRRKTTGKKTPQGTKAATD